MKEFQKDNKWNYVFKMAFLWTIVLGLFNSFIYTFFIEGTLSNELAKLIVGFLAGTIAFILINLPFGIIIGLMLWKSKKKETGKV
ncbi:MAG: hypothetical protein ACK4M9_22400 [Anaerobacillus sp.]|uniref:hypothetical protein n=1 Tax=Anaerobacillus sp. TaxID=1872506 RepID=UPI00391C92D1